MLVFPITYQDPEHQGSRRAKNSKILLQAVNQPHREDASAWTDVISALGYKSAATKWPENYNRATFHKSEFST